MYLRARFVLFVAGTTSLVRVSRSIAQIIWPRVVVEFVTAFLDLYPVYSELIFFSHLFHTRARNSLRASFYHYLKINKTFNFDRTPIAKRKVVKNTIHFDISQI